MLESLPQLNPQIVLASVKAAVGVAARYQDLPLKSALLDVQEKALELVIKATELQSELATAQQRIRELEAELRQAKGAGRAGLTMEHGVFWASHSREHSEDGPFCSTCLDTKNVRVLMQKMNDGSAYCPGCEKVRIPRVWPEIADAYNKAAADAMMPRRVSWMNPTR